ncbi:MAG: ExeM/NucH family extracellular endonuclease, partial [Xanthomonadaceae bacterium]|nr:ExeM/NucH family extracellular endonuclease [Xanthomonadaceae bacterium]
MLFRLFPAAVGLIVAGAAAAQGGSLAIGAIQGSGDRSPHVGERVVVEGVVTSMLTGPRSGFFLQDAGDGDPATSDAIFVDADGFPGPGPKVGTSMRLSGVVAEVDAGKGTLTVLQAASVELARIRSRPVKAGPVVRLKAPPADWEPYEGMRVRIDTPLYVAGTHRLARDGALFAHFGEERLRTPTEAAAPGDQARALAADNARRLLRLDDGSDEDRPASVWYLGDTPRTGSRLTRVEGVVDQRGGGYRLQLTSAPRVLAAKPPAPPKVGGDVRIAGLNLENFFNGDGAGGGFPTPRGARTPVELDAQLTRLVATIRGLAPDIAALMEVENDGFGPESAIALLVKTLNDDGSDWRFVDAGKGPGSDQIRVGMLYRASRVTPVGAPATLEDDLFGTHSRPPLAQSFRAGKGPVFTVVANHFKSKGCGEASGTDADQKDGQGCWNAARTESSRRLDTWLRTDPTRSGSDLRMIVGDLNAYRMEDPVRLLVDAGWRDAFAGHRGETPYSYVYDNQTGRLDHALLSPSLAARLVDAAEWHSNADEPDSRGYQEAPGQRGPWRSSDHDPLVVGF